MELPHLLMVSTSGFPHQATWQPKIPGPRPVSQSAVQRQGPIWNRWSFESTPPARETNPLGSQGEQREKQTRVWMT